VRVNCHQVSKQFQSKNAIISALENVSFQQEEHEFLCILGPSGCGKTTLLRIISGLLKTTTGNVTFEGTRSHNGPLTAMVFQEHGIFPWTNVIDNICFSLEMRGTVKKERYRLAMPIVERMGLTKFIKNYPHQLSSGMKQRVGLARALLSGADILLMDEPFAALDAQMRKISQEKLLEIHREYHRSVIFITHDIDEALLLADRIILLTRSPGRIKGEFNIPFGRPRNISGEYAGELAKLKLAIWNQIKEEVEADMDLIP